MSVVVLIAKVAAVSFILTVIFSMLPDAVTLPEGADSVPDFITAPVFAVLKLDRYLPIHEGLLILGTLVTIQLAMLALFLWSWILKRLQS